MPVVGHGDVLPDVEKGGVLGITTVGGGLTPPAPSSVEPSGIPVRATDDAEPIPVGDEADAAGPAKELLPTAAQVPDAVPAMPPPSKVDIPMPEDVSAIEVPVPDVAPPALEHVVLLAVNPIGDVPDVVGLTPGDASPVAPRGIPVGATAGAGPMPSGDVMPSGDEPGDIAPTCAAAAPQPKTATTITAINKRVIAGLSSFGIRSTSDAIWHPDPPHSRPSAHDLAWITEACPVFRRWRPPAFTKVQSFCSHLRELTRGCGDTPSGSARSPCETPRRTSWSR